MEHLEIFDKPADIWEEAAKIWNEYKIQSMKAKIAELELQMASDKCNIQYHVNPPTLTKYPYFHGCDMDDVRINTIDDLSYAMLDGETHD